jgi:hypothetical protein
MKVTFEFNTSDENFDCIELEQHYIANDMPMCINDIKEQVYEWYNRDKRSNIPTEEILDKILDIINDYVNMNKLGY